MEEKGLSWWKLSLIGVGCMIGTGYFLGSSLAVQQAGASVLFVYFIAGIITWFVFQALAKMTADHVEKGSFRTYAKQAFGPWAGFSNGWMYWSGEVLIMGSQLTALAIFAKFWFPSVPVWIFASIFSLAGLAVLYLGVKKVEDMENIFGLMKAAAIVMFIGLGSAVLFGWINIQDPAFKVQTMDFGTGEWTGILVALLYAFYAFGGIEVMGLMAGELRDPKEVEKSGRIMILLLTGLYLVSFYLVVKLAPVEEIDTEESPFLTALKTVDWGWVSHGFNGVLIIAGFSTMVASLYAVTVMASTLAEEGDAPAFLKNKGDRNIPLPAFLLTTSMVAASVVLALLLPDKIFAYITTAAGLMLLYNWLFILFSYRKLMNVRGVSSLKVWIGAGALLLGVIGTWFDKTSRTGLWVSFAFLAVIAAATLVKQRRNQR
ncbi:amino acid permease [Halobacillus litoralis]|uniref:amino acid permease n=1 Tax=Halobacillus litoralis TaxID=45668 RepID=UPI001CD316BE|nr:amino acid permease [Halobacillus litoralis]MCA0971686.1 amino acid permease [Halobacillus litoralis]